jgi:sulfopyruvate decarboxylase alpha subunit
MNKKNFFNLLRNEKSEKANYLHQLFKERGVNFATGVPCGVLHNIIDNLVNDLDVLHISANRESEAIGIAAGAYLSGKTPIIYMQNSGLFASSNDIASLLIPYRIPILFVVTYRGCEGEDAVQHFTTGKATEKLLESFGLFYWVYEQQALKVLVDQIFSKMKETSLPVVLLLKRGWNR